MSTLTQPSEPPQPSASHASFDNMINDPISEDTYKELDTRVTNQLKEWIPLGQPLTEKSRARVLYTICSFISIMIEGFCYFETTDEAQEFIEKHPELGEMVNRAWIDMNGFSSIRRSGECTMIYPRLHVATHATYPYDCRTSMAERQITKWQG